IEDFDLFVARQALAFVDEHPHTHAAIGSAQKSIDDQPARFVAPENVVLQIERAFGGIDHLNACTEAVDACGHQPVTRRSAVFACGAVELAAETRFDRIAKRSGRRLRKIGSGRQRCAAGDEREKEKSEREALQHRDALRGLNGELHCDLQKESRLGPPLPCGEEKEPLACAAWKWAYARAGGAALTPRRPLWRRCVRSRFAPGCVP